MSREALYEFKCDAASDSFGHTGSNVSTPVAQLPAGWTLLQLADGTRRRFCTPQEAVDYLNGDLDAPVERGVSQKFRYVCDNTAGHPGGDGDTEIFNTTGQLPEPPQSATSWVMATMPDGSPGWFHEAACALTVISTTN